MCEPGLPVGTQGRQHIFHPRFESPVQLQRGKLRVAGLFQALEKIVAQACLVEYRALPVALLNPVAVYQVQRLYAEFGGVAQNPAQHFGTGQGDDERDGQLCRRRGVEYKAQPGAVLIQADDFGAAHQAVDLTHA